MAAVVSVVEKISEKKLSNNDVSLIVFTPEVKASLKSSLDAPRS